MTHALSIVLATLGALAVAGGKDNGESCSRHDPLLSVTPWGAETPTILAERTLGHQPLSLCGQPPCCLHGLRLRGGLGSHSKTEKAELQRRDDERERAVTTGILKHLKQKAGGDADRSMPARVSVRKGSSTATKDTKNGLAVPRKKEGKSSRMHGDDEVFERDGLEFQRTNDDAKYLLQQMREGNLGDDPLEHARTFMDSDEVDDWDALYDDKDSDAAKDDGPTECVLQNSGVLAPAITRSSGIKPPSSKSKKLGMSQEEKGKKKAQISHKRLDEDADQDAPQEVLQQEQRRAQKTSKMHAGAKQSTKPTSGTPTRVARANANANALHDLDLHTPPSKSVLLKHTFPLSTPVTPISAARKVSFSHSPVSAVHEYPKGKQRWCTAEEVESAAAESWAEEQERSPWDTQEYNPSEETSETSSSWEKVKTPHSGLAPRTTAQEESEGSEECEESVESEDQHSESKESGAQDASIDKTEERKKREEGQRGGGGRGERDRARESLDKARLAQSKTSTKRKETESKNSTKPLPPPLKQKAENNDNTNIQVKDRKKKDRFVSAALDKEEAVRKRPRLNEQEGAGAGAGKEDDAREREGEKGELAGVVAAAAGEAKRDDAEILFQGEKVGSGTFSPKPRTAVPFLTVARGMVLVFQVQQAGKEESGSMLLPAKNRKITAAQLQDIGFKYKKSERAFAMSVGDLAKYLSSGSSGGGGGVSRSGRADVPENVMTFFLEQNLHAHLGLDLDEHAGFDRREEEEVDDDDDDEDEEGDEDSPPTSVIDDGIISEIEREVHTKFPKAIPSASPSCASAKRDVFSPQKGVSSDDLLGETGEVKREAGVREDRRHAAEGAESASTQRQGRRSEGQERERRGEGRREAAQGAVSASSSVSGSTPASLFLQGEGEGSEQSKPAKGEKQAERQDAVGVCVGGAGGHTESKEWQEAERQEAKRDTRLRKQTRSKQSQESDRQEAVGKQTETKHIVKKGGELERARASKTPERDPPPSSSPRASPAKPAGQAREASRKPADGVHKPPRPPPQPQSAPSSGLRKTHLREQRDVKGTFPAGSGKERSVSNKETGSARSKVANVRERKDATGMFPAGIAWESKLEMLRLAKQDAWHNGATRFSRHLFLWEKRVGLRSSRLSLSRQTERASKVGGQVSAKAGTPGACT